MTLTRFAGAGAALLAALALSACGGGSEGGETSENVMLTNIEAPPVDTGNMDNVVTDAPPATQVDNTAGEVPAPPPAVDVPADEQTQADADATGMTARVSRDEGGNETGRPVE
jgi:hypothetical protein